LPFIQAITSDTRNAGEEREGDDGVEVRAAAPAQRADRQQAAGAGEQQHGDQQPR